MSDENFFRESHVQNQPSDKSFNNYNAVQNDQDEQRNRAIAVVFSNLFAFSQAVFQLGFKFVFLSGMDLFTAVFLRYLSSLCFDFVMLKCYQKKMMDDLSSTTIKVFTFIRSVVFFAGLVAILISIQNIPTSLAVLVQQTGGLWASIMGYFILKDSLASAELVCLISGYLGVILILSGGSGNSEDQDFKGNYILGMSAAFVSSVCIGATMILSRMLRSVHFIVLTVHYDIFSVAVSLLMLGVSYFYSTNFFSLETSEARDYILLITFALCSAISIIFQTIAYQIEKAGIVGAISYTMVLYCYIGDIFIFQDSFTTRQILGGLLILAANFYLALKPKPPQTN